MTSSKVPEYCRAFTQAADYYLLVASKLSDAKRQKEFGEFLVENFESRDVAERIKPALKAVYDVTETRSKEQLDDWILMHTRGSTDLAEAVHKLMTAEKKWDDFLWGLDEAFDELWRPDKGDELENEKMIPVDRLNQIVFFDNELEESQSLDKVLNGTSFSKTYFLLHCYLGCPACLQWTNMINDNLSIIHSHNVNIVLVAKASREAARMWKEQLDLPLPLLVDEEAQFIKAMGIRRSLYNLWRADNLHMVVTKPTNEWLSIEDSGRDVYLQGADIVITKEGLLRYKRQTPGVWDRPMIDQLLVEFYDGERGESPEQFVVTDDGIFVVPKADGKSKQQEAKKSKTCSIL